MGVERGLVVVLLVEEKPPGVGRRPVCQVHPAARLGDRVLGQLGEKCDGFVFVARLDDEGDGEADHRNLQTRFPDVNAVTILANHPRQDDKNPPARDDEIRRIERVQRAELEVTS